MAQILKGLGDVECNIDNDLVHGSDQEEHDERVASVLKHLLEAGVTLNIEKCVFSKITVKCLGHIINPNGIEADPKKVIEVADLPPPKNVQG